MRGKLYRGGFFFLKLFIADKFIKKPGNPTIPGHNNSFFAHYTLALRIAKNREDAEEIAQDAFMNAFKSLNSFKKKSRFSTWLYKIVYNEAISRCRKTSLSVMLLKKQ